MVSKPRGAEVVEAVGDPVDVLFDRHGHVGQHRRAARTGDGEEVGEADRGEAEIGRRPVGPLLPERDAVTAPDVDGDHRAGHGVEPGGVHDGVELEGLVRGVDPRLGDGGDRMLAQIDQPDVGQVVGLEVVRVEARSLGSERVVLGAEGLGRLGVHHDRADLLADHLGHDRRWTPGSTRRSLNTPRIPSSSPASHAASKRSRRTSSVRAGPGDLGDLGRDAGARQLGRVAVGGPVGLERGEALRRRRSVAGGYARSSPCAGRR